MTRTVRKITVELTDAQYAALAGAMSDADSMDEGENSPYRVRSARSRAAAWAKINEAWHAKERRAKPTPQRHRAPAPAVSGFQVGPFDLEAETERIWGQPAIRETLGYRWRDGKSHPPPVKFRRSRMHVSSSGVCYHDPRRVVVTVGSDPYDAVLTLAHELCHAAAPIPEGHQPAFWSRFRAVCREAWPDVAFEFHRAPERGLTLHRWTRDRLRAALTGEDLP